MSRDRYDPPVLLAIPRRRTIPVPGAARARLPSGDDGGIPSIRPVPKPDGGVRWLTDLGPVDHAAYRSAVTPLLARIERSLGAEVLANRARWGSGGWGLAPWRLAWRTWQRMVTAAAREARPRTIFAVADVRDCYGSVSPDAVSSVLGPAADPLVAFLRRLGDAGVRGLPVGPDPSAVVANASLEPLDDAVRSSGAGHFRWVDDLVLWGTRREAIRGLDALHRAAAGLGLELHPGKTRLLEGPDELRARRCSILAP